MRSLTNQFATLALLTVVMSVIGCGVSAYESRMQDRLAELQRLSKFIDLLNDGPIAVAETGVSLKLPRIFDENSNALVVGAKNESELTIDPKRVQPPFVDLPGFQFSYERFAQDDTGVWMPVFCYLAVEDTANITAGELKSSIRKGIKDELKTDADWEEIQIDSPSGQTADWSRVSVTAPQKFDCTVHGGEYKDFPGRFDLYLHTTDDRHVLIGFRAPDAVAGTWPLFQAAEAAIGTVTIEPPPAPADAKNRASEGGDGEPTGDA